MGLQELKNFQAVNPHADLEPFLAKSSPYFRKYIERGLASIEANSAGNGGLGLTGNSEVPVLAEANRVPVVTGGDGNTPSAFMRYKDFMSKKYVRSLTFSSTRTYGPLALQRSLRLRRNKCENLANFEKEINLHAH